MNRIFEYFNRKSRAKTRKKLLLIIRDAKATTNRGLVRKALGRLPHINFIQVSGGVMVFVTLIMDDGYEILASDVFESYAARKAIGKAAWRLRERGLV